MVGHVAATGLGMTAQGGERLVVGIVKRTGGGRVTVGDMGAS